MEDDDAPATKSDIRELNAHLERAETNLLTEFHKWAQTYEVGARGTTQAVHEFDERLGLLEERISRLERGGRA